MKICHILDELTIGGLEKTVIQIVSGLTGYTHEVWCLKNKGILAGGLEKKGVRVKAFGLSGRIRPSDIFNIAGHMRKECFDIAHCHGHYPSVTGRAAAILAGVPVRIVHAQNLYYWIKLKDRVRLKALSYFTRDIIAVSEAVKKSLVGFVGISPRRITVVYNSSPDMAAMALVERREARARLGIGADDFVVGAVGRLDKEKGYHILVDAIGRLDRGVRLVIVGEGPQRDELEMFIASRGLKGPVILTGARHDVADILSAIDCFVQPSVYTEGLPLVLAEAASASLPLIATDVGGNPEIVRDHSNGFVIETGDPIVLSDKIAYLMAQPEKRREMGARSREIWEERFSESIMLDKIRKIYGA